MYTEKQRQQRHDDARLTESKQLRMMPKELLTNRQWLPGELLSELEHRRPGCF